MILTAKDMHNSPAQAYREADKGETVIINHDRYPDKVFELTARERRHPQLNLSDDVDCGMIDLDPKGRELAAHFLKCYDEKEEGK